MITNINVDINDHYTEAAVRASIVIVMYNSRPYLPACLDSLLADIQINDEVIVIDNGSTDGSADFIQTAYPQLRLERGANIGYAGGNNHGASLAGGEYIIFLNPDTVVEHGSITALVEPLISQPAIGLVTACVVHMDQPEAINACGNTMHYTGLTYCRGAGCLRGEYETATEVDAVSGAAFAIRRTLFAELGGFDGRFFMYVEDSDLSWRARRKGYHCWYTPAAVVRHDYHPSYSPDKAFWLDRNRHAMMLKNLPLGLYWRMLPGLILAEAVTWGFLLIKGPGYWGVKLRVYRRLAREWRQFRADHQRDSVPQQRDQRIVEGMEYRLEFGQLAGRGLSFLAGVVFHPAFWLARLGFATKAGAPSAIACETTLYKEHTL